AAGQGVVPGAAVQNQLDQLARVGRGEVRGVHAVVPAEGVHRQRVVPALRANDVHEGNRAHGGVDARPDGLDLGDVVAGGAVEDDGVGLAVVAARGAGEVQVEGIEAGRGLVVDGDGVGA